MQGRLVGSFNRLGQNQHGFAAGTHTLSPSKADDQKSGQENGARRIAEAYTLRFDGGRFFADVRSNSVTRFQTSHNISLQLEAALLLPSRICQMRGVLGASGGQAVCTLLLPLFYLSWGWGDYPVNSVVTANWIIM